MNYGIRPLADQGELRCSSFDAVQDGVLGLIRGTGGNCQRFDQAINFPPIVGEFFDRQAVGDGVGVVRDLMRGILRGTESMVETVRQSIRCSFSESVSDFALNELDERYGEITARTLRSFLGQIHWRLMLAKSGCDDQQFGCLEFMSAHNPPRFYDVDFGGESDIPLVGEHPGDVIAGMQAAIRLAQAERQRAEALRAHSEAMRRRKEATKTAKSLLATICGEKIAWQFDWAGFIKIEQNGYKFEIPPNGFIGCTDSDGKTARLCIHSRGFQVNPVDEVILAYLQIRHNFTEFMQEAIIHDAQRGFRRFPKRAA
jgi:hypothetical protein